MRGKKSPLGEQLSKLKPQHRDWIVGQMRWELLRRNENYRKAYDEFATANPQCVPSSDSLKGKQSQDNQSDQVKIFDGSVLIPAATAFANKWGCFPREPKTGETRFPALHQNPGMVIPQFDEQSRSLSLRFPLNMSAEIILDQVKYWVSFYKKSHPARMMKMRLEDVLRAIAVYDLKTKEGKVYPDIANELGLDGGDSLQSGIVELQASAQAPEVIRRTKVRPEPPGSSARRSKSKDESKDQSTGKLTE